MIKDIGTKITEGIDKFYKAFQKQKVLKTMEEVEANTDEENLASALLLSELNNNLKSMFKIVKGVCTSEFTLNSLDHCLISFQYTIPSGYRAIGVVGFDGVSWGAAFATLDIGIAVVTNASRGTITVPANQVTETILCVKNDFI